MFSAEWRPEVSFLYKGVDPNVVSAEIRGIGDAATPEQIVERAKDETSELHKCFTWNDTEAAKKWRLQEARNVVHCLVIRQEPGDEKPSVRVFHKVENGQGYKAAPLCFTVDGEYQKLLQRAMAELRAFKVKYARLSELDEILALIQ